MTKIITTLLVTLLFVSCGSEENGQEKKFELEKKVEVKVEAAIEQNKVVAPAVPSVEKKVEKIPEKKVETYAKNIFELTTTDGNILHVDEAANGITFQEHQDKVVFLVFFGYRCPPCLAEMPALKKLVKEKGDKITVIGVEVQRLQEDKLKVFKKSKQLNYTIVSGNNENNSKFISYIAERAQWTGSIPFLVGIKPQGEVGVVHVGMMRDEELNTVFNKLSK